MMNFHHCANIKKVVNINKRFFLKHLYILKSYSVLQWVLGLVAKI
jgi:hypothetical protein